MNRKKPVEVQSWSTAEFATRWGISQKTVRELIRVGELRAIKIQSRWRITRDNELTWLERKYIESDEELENRQGEWAGEVNAL